MVYLDPECWPQCACNGLPFPQPLEADIAPALSLGRQVERAAILQLCVPAGVARHLDIPL